MLGLNNTSPLLCRSDYTLPVPARVASRFLDFCHLAGPVTRDLVPLSNSPTGPYISKWTVPPDQSFQKYMVPPWNIQSPRADEGDCNFQNKRSPWTNSNWIGPGEYFLRQQDTQGQRVVQMMRRMTVPQPRRPPKDGYGTDTCRVLGEGMPHNGEIQTMNLLMRLLIRRFGADKWESRARCYIEKWKH